MTSVLSALKCARGPVRWLSRGTGIPEPCLGPCREEGVGRAVSFPSPSRPGKLEPEEETAGNGDCCPSPARSLSALQRQGRAGRGSQIQPGTAQGLWAHDRVHSAARPSTGTLTHAAPHRPRVRRGRSAPRLPRRLAELHCVGSRP